MKEKLSKHTIERSKHGPFFYHRVDVLRVKQKKPTEDALPLLILPGFLANGNPKVFEDVAKEFADLGRETHVVTFKRWFRGSKLSKAAREKEVAIEKPKKGNPSIIEFNKAVALLDYMNTNSLEKVVLAPHSLESQAAMYAVAMSPEKFAKVEGVTPTGYNKKYPVKFLTLRFLLQIIPEIVNNLWKKKSRRATRRHLIAGAAMLTFHPIRSLWYERRTIRRTNQIEIFNRCTADPEYPDIIILAGKKDGVFGPKHLAVDHKTYDGGHNDFIAGRLTQQIDQDLH